MFDHLGLQAADVDAAAAFYLRVFAPLGFTEAVRFEDTTGLVVGIAGRDGRPQLWLSPAQGDETREAHVAFVATSRAEVEAVHEAATAAGVEVLHPPKEWPIYDDGYYGVFLRDPDGHNVEAVHRG